MREKRKSNFGDKIGRNLQHRKEAKKSYGYLNLPKGLPILNLKEGTQRIDLDFLPYVVTNKKHPDRNEKEGIAVENDLWFRSSFKVHRNVGPDDETVVCPRTFGKPCPICEHREKRAKEGAEKDELRELYGKPRSLYAVIPLGIDKYEEVVTVWDMSDKLFQDTLDEELEINEEFSGFVGLEGGATANIRLRWKSFGGNTFPEVRSVSFTERDDYDENILNEVPKLDDLLKVLSYEEIEAKFFEIENETDGGDLKEVEEEEEEEEKVSPRNKYRKVEKEEEEEEEEKVSPRNKYRKVEKEEEKSTSIRRPEREKKVERGNRTSKKMEEYECPYGHRFGVDTEDFKECDTCDLWGKCLDVKEGK